GSEADGLLGTDGQAHAFSPTVEASFSTNTLYGFIYNYADGGASYDGRVSDDGSFGYAAIAASNSPYILVVDPASGNFAGYYTVFVEGTTSSPSGTVLIDHYRLAGQTFAADGSSTVVAGTDGLGSETGQLIVGRTSFPFSDLQEVVGTALLSTGTAQGVLVQDGPSDTAPAVTGATIVMGADLSTPFPLQFVGTGDSDGNGRGDIAYTNSGNLVLWLNSPGVFSQSVVPNAHMGPEWAAYGTDDFNGDNK